jgi:hypothetical protein
MAGLYVCGKSRLPGFDPRTVQPVASRYTDYAIPVQSVSEVLIHSDPRNKKIPRILSDHKAIFYFIYSL